MMKLTKNLVLNWTYRIGLPLKVRSTAFQLCDRLEGFFGSLEKMDSFELSCFKAKSCIFLGCKFEDIHGHLDKIMEQIEVKSGLMQMPRILELETQMIEFIGFEFSYTDLYQSALAVQLLLEEAIQVPWETTVECLNKALLTTNLQNSLMEVVLSSFPTGIYSKLNLIHRDEVINEIKNNSSGVTYLTDKEIREAIVERAII